MLRLFNPTLILILLCAVPWCGCFGPLAKRLADSETYPIIEDKKAVVLKERKGPVIAGQGAFSIEPTTTTLTNDVVHKAGYSSDQFTTSGLVISLSDALFLAIDNNRDYKTRMEQVYLAALNLTEEEYIFSPVFSGSVSARAVRRPGPAPTVERFGDVATNFAVTKLFATGARITVGLTNNFVKYFNGTRTESATGLLAASFVQPLLAGAGPLVTLENLRQADRDVVYQLRSFARYQSRFVVDRIAQYYRLLQAYDEIENEEAAYKRLMVARQRAEAMEQAQRMAAFQVDQALQDEIKARNRWLTARTDYSLQLDQFKLDLGMPPELNIQPDRKELETLQKMSLVELKYDLPTAEHLAQEGRLDYRTALNRAEDADRKVLIAENALLPVVNARLNASLPDSGNKQPLDLEWRRRTYSGGIDAELPLDRMSERNDFRAALIQAEQSRRAAEELRNDLIAEVRRAYQNVDQARQSYEIQEKGLRLAERRVDNVEMLMQIGRENISIRDQLEAESALRDAKNAVTKVLVDYVIARLEFYHAIEALEINERGMWKDES